MQSSSFRAHQRFSSSVPPVRPVQAHIGIARVQDVLVDSIDVSDLTFQYRIRVTVTDLRDSLAREGQQEPVHLLASSPHRVVDGFRRLEAIRLLGWRTVRAFVHEALTEEQAHSIAFVNNVVRTNLSPLEKARGIYLARQRGRDRSDIARCLGLSEKQVRRYEALMNLPPELLRLLDSHRVSMAHAKILIDSGVTNVAEWALQACDAGWSSQQLRARLSNGRGRAAQRKKAHFRFEHNCLRVSGFTISRHATQHERNAVIEELQQAISYLTTIGC